jgi:hypothetical protein
VFTVTLEGKCNFHLRMYANQENEIKLPSVDCTDAECIQDFEL